MDGKAETAPANAPEPEGDLPIRVLVVEDQGTYRRLIEAYLNQGNEGRFQLIFVSTSRDAIDVLGKRNVDAVLLDLGLPDATWEFDALERILDRTMVPVVVLTAEAERFDVAREAAARGAEDCLFKDEITPERLQRAIVAAMERFRYRHGEHPEALSPDAWPGR